MMVVVEGILTLIFMAIMVVLVAIHAIYCRLGHILETQYLIAQRLEKLPAWQVVPPGKPYKRCLNEPPKAGNVGEKYK